MEVYNSPQKNPPNNHLALAIVTTLLCCQPAGIVSIVYASQVNSKYIAGDYAGAERASANAKTWWIVSIVIGVLGWLIVVGFYGLGFLLAIFNS
ncbi:MAG: CD225/dispanin family protein [Psychroflexus sp.]|jgi:hypothetical protein|nr:CD225/dispanin family protein [Psychroflexus sp.]MDR9448895.1 CD225/dispanin family protein [Psychroflexus sp.]